MIAQVPTMVAPQDDDRVLRQPILLERREHAADLRVHITHRRVVAVNQLPRIVIRHRSLVRHARVVAQLAPGRPANGGAPSGGVRRSANLKLAGSYKSQYFFGAQNGKCGFTKPTAKKNGCFGSFAALSSRLIASSAVCPSGYELSGTSADSYATPFAKSFAFAPATLLNSAASREFLFASRMLLQRVVHHVRVAKTARSTTHHPRGSRARGEKPCPSPRYDNRSL